MGNAPREEKFSQSLSDETIGSFDVVDLGYLTTGTDAWPMPTFTPPPAFVVPP